MRGIKFFNFPAFFQADEFLRKLGYDVVNPAYLDVLSGFDARDLPEDTDWSVLPSDLDMREVISRDLELLCGCDTIYLLEGWMSSKGARSEKSVAEWLGLSVWYQEDRGRRTHPPMPFKNPSRDHRGKHDLDGFFSYPVMRAIVEYMKGNPRFPTPP